MSKSEELLEDGGRPELTLQQYVKALREELRQQLQETERRQEEELQRRIHQNALLSTERPPPALASSTSRERCPVRTQPRERCASCKTTQEIREEEATAECQKKFCALPVPGHVGRPVYREMMELRERERKQRNQERRLFLLSTLKPFGFQEREKEKREKLLAASEQVAEEQKNSVTPARKPPSRDMKHSPDAEPEERQAVIRKVHTQTAAVRQETPTRSGSPKLRTAERTRRERLGFLDQTLSFQPKIIREVPDFSRLHKALQKEAPQKTASKDGIKCQPFNLRTAELPARKSRLSLETSQVPKISNLSRSKSLGALTSISAATLPTYITDAVRKRSEVIRRSVEMRESRNQESERWLKSYQLRSEAMRKTVARHAKLLDPHSSLKEVYNEKLQRHRAADQQRMREYARELGLMRARVRERPYLFEQVKQKTARAQAEQIFRNTLQKASLKEEFVEETAEAHSCEDDTDTSDSGAPHREENVDDGEKIEDVEEKSVKSKGEEMP
ncbi:protein FAM161B [Salarias fasciatus]|uniref:protein FAM161B n=1 Tax=Salarias fasciatus TaxID=181472 RepID=UPI0011769AA6|nr:protein FAM161B [Salarias fasciatus]